MRLQSPFEILHHEVGDESVSDEIFFLLNLFRVKRTIKQSRLSLTLGWQLAHRYVNFCSTPLCLWNPYSDHFLCLLRGSDSNFVQVVKYRDLFHH